MKGHIYIAGSFSNLNYSKCRKSSKWIDNDPYVWDEPYTWGICRPDIRNKMEPGDYVFFVLPEGSELPRMIFAHLRIKKIITHMEAYKKFRKYRMNGKKNPDGNILVDKYGNHNKADRDEYGRFIHKFDRIKNYYAIANMHKSHRYNEDFIKKKAPEFMKILRKVLKKKGGKIPYDLISKYGQWLTEKQVKQLLNWLNS